MHISKKIIQARISRYDEPIEMMALLPMGRQIELKSLNLRDTFIQTAYRDCKKDGFEEILSLDPGDQLIKFLCYLSACYLISEVKKDLVKDFCLQDIAQKIIYRYETDDRAVIRNFLRFMRFPTLYHHFLNEIAKDVWKKEPKSKSRADRMAFHRILDEFCFQLIEQEMTAEEPPS